MSSLSNHEQAAGSSFIARCNACMMLMRIYDRSLYGNGKRCTNKKCKTLLEPKISYTTLEGVDIHREANYTVIPVLYKNTKV